MKKEYIAIYLRLSLEDRVQEGSLTQVKEESNSITSQRKMLREYIRKDTELATCEVLEFCDDADIIGLNQKTFDLRGFTD